MRNDNKIKNLDDFNLSIVNISTLVPTIVDRIIEIYKIYVPEVYKIICKRIEENGADVFKRQFDAIGRKVDRYLCDVPFLNLCQVVDESLYCSLIEKLKDLNKIVNSQYVYGEYGGDPNCHFNVYGLQNIAVDFENSTEEFENLSEYKLHHIFVGKNPNFLGNLSNCNPLPGPDNLYTTLPVISMHNKFNKTLFNQIFNSTKKDYFMNSQYDKVVGINENVYAKNNNKDFANTGKTHGNIMIIDISGLFRICYEIFDLMYYEYFRSKDIDFKVFSTKLPDMPFDERIENRDRGKTTANGSLYTISRVMEILDYYDVIKLEDKKYIGLIDELNLNYQKLVSRIKNKITASAIKTYITNVGSRLNEYATNYMVDDLVNKYLTITSHDKEIMNSGIANDASDLRERAYNFYAFFSRFLAGNGKRMISWDSISHEYEYICGNSVLKKASPISLVYLLLKKCYEHAIVTYNTAYTMIDTPTSFTFKSSNDIYNKMIFRLKGEAKIIVESLNDYLINAFVDKEDEIFLNKNPLYNNSKNHRAMSIIYKQIAIIYINLMDSFYKLSSLTDKEDEAIAMPIEKHIEILKTKIEVLFKVLESFTSSSIPRISRFYNYKKNIDKQFKRGFKNANYGYSRLLKGFNDKDMKLFYNYFDLSTSVFYDGDFNQMPDLAMNIDENNIRFVTRKIFNILSKKSSILSRNRRFSRIDAIPVEEIRDDGPLVDAVEVEVDCDENDAIYPYGEDLLPEDYDDIYFDVGLLLNESTYTRPARTSDIHGGLPDVDSISSEDFKYIVKQPTLDLDKLYNFSKKLIKREGKTLDIATIALHAKIAVGQLSEEEFEKNKVLIGKIDNNINKALMLRIKQREDNYLQFGLFDSFYKTE